MKYSSVFRSLFHNSTVIVQANLKKTNLIIYMAILEPDIHSHGINLQWHPSSDFNKKHYN